MLCLSSESYLIIALFSWIYTNSRRLFLIYSTLTALNTTSIQNMDAEMFKHASDVWGSIRNTHAHTCTRTHRYDTVSPTCVSMLIQRITPRAYSVGSHLHVVIGSTCQGCRRRERVRRAGSTQPECHVLRLCMYSHARVCLTAPVMEYEDSPPHQWPAVMDRGRAVFSRLGYLLGCLFLPARVCPAPTPQSQNHRDGLDVRLRAGLLSSLFHFILQS